MKASVYVYRDGERVGVEVDGGRYLELTGEVVPGEVVGDVWRDRGRGQMVSGQMGGVCFKGVGRSGE